ncbi:MAG TPA: hypothetical protein VJ596_04470, partial [Gemmatimonadaceae bacterium]|nr:hypothetical protein [Gemmatimonadaceae bacterium]
MRPFPAVVMLLSLAPSMSPAQSQECRVLMLKRTPDGVTLESLSLPNDSARAFPVSETLGTLALVAPFGLGHSSTRIDASRPKLFSARCTGGELHIRTREPDGIERVFPAIRMADVAYY